MSIRFILLALLLDGPRSASQLQNAFSTTTEGVWPLTISQVTQTLGRLLRDDLIETASSPGGDHFATYRLSSSGRKELNTWWNTPVRSPATEGDELVGKVILATTHPEINLIVLLDQQREALIDELRELNQWSRGLAASRTAERLNLEHRIFLLEARVRWLDRVESLADPDPTLTPENER
ncbi:hypothetical protein COCCU_03935 [Corynebacterium occultum]|uniref:Uncharacterized protein n=1 Tax=Corynebacterium occultum TaxID=2675219 RepID=A0A6B8W5Z4_9CORY|nr:PadR family transcriptional regulator [Corynebacterium occultum]QGU06735.1 hypothetical protein COCCU_03935 [Corynebacterium occultum]